MKMRSRLGMMAVGLGVLAGSLCGSVADGNSVRSNVFEKVRAVFCETQQIFTISVNGDYKVEKLGHSSERKFDGRIFTDGTPGFFPSQTNQQEE